MNIKHCLLVLIVLLVISLFTGCNSNNLTSGVPKKDGWGIFTNTQTVNDWITDEDYIWMATDGGILRLDTKTDTFQKYTILDGLLSNSIDEIRKDSSGTLWVCNRYGLNSFNGKEWDSIIFNNTLDYNYIRSFFIDEDDNLWICAGYGVYTWNGAEWEKVVIDDDQSLGLVKGIFQDTKNRFWFISSEKIDCLDGDYWKHFNFSEHSYINLTCSIVEDQAGRILAGTSNDGIIYIDGDKSFFYTELDNLSGNSIRTLFKDSGGIIWAGTNGGASSFNGDLWTSYTTIDPEISDMEVYRYFEDTNETPWCAYRESGNGGGTGYFKNGSWHSLFNEDTMFGNGILEDKSGNLWFILTEPTLDISNNDRLVKYSNGDLIEIRLPNELPSNSLRTVIRDSNNNLWIGTFHSGVGRFDGNLWTAYNQQDGLSGLWVTTIEEDAEGVIWCNALNPYVEVISEYSPGFLGQGINKYDGENWSSYFTGDSYGFDGEYIWDILLDSDNTLWFCTEKGLKLFDGTQLYQDEICEGLPESRIESITQARDGSLWVIKPFGIARYDGENWNINPFEGMPEKQYISSILQDTSGDYWFGTSQEGLYRYSNGNWEHFTEENELLDNEINDIVQDSKGNIWVGTEGGLNKYDGNTWAEILDPGVAWSNVWDMYIDNNDTIWFATDQGLFFYSN